MNGSNKESCKILVLCVYECWPMGIYTCKAERQILQTWSITVALMQALLIIRHDGAAN